MSAAVQRGTSIFTILPQALGEASAEHKLKPHSLRSDNGQAALIPLIGGMAALSSHLPTTHRIQ